MTQPASTRAFREVVEAGSLAAAAERRAMSAKARFLLGPVMKSDDTTPTHHAVRAGMERSTP